MNKIFLLFFSVFFFSVAVLAQQPEQRELEKERQELKKELEREFSIISQLIAPRGSIGERDCLKLFESIDRYFSDGGKLEDNTIKRIGKKTRDTNYSTNIHLLSLLNKGFKFDPIFTYNVIKKCAKNDTDKFIKELLYF